MIIESGIYALFWEDLGSVYIGRSCNIYNRFTQHISKLRYNKHSNYKVQEVYNRTKVPPILVIIERCSEGLHATRETAWTSEFDSINTGLNIVAAGSSGGSGVHGSTSKYSRIEILQVTRMLSSASIHTYISISIATGVSEASINKLASGCTHSWIQKEYPWHYKNIIANRPLRQKNIALTNTKRRSTIFIVKSPRGTLHNLSDATKFCRGMAEFNTSEEKVHTAANGFARLTSGTRKSYLGWTVISSSSI